MQVSDDIPRRDKIHQLQCNNSFIKQLQIIYAPVICKSGPHGACDSRDIDRLTFHILTNTIVAAGLCNSRAFDAMSKLIGVSSKLPGQGFSQRFGYNNVPTVLHTQPLHRAKVEFPAILRPLTAVVTNTSALAIKLYICNVRIKYCNSLPPIFTRHHCLRISSN